MPKMPRGLPTPASSTDIKPKDGPSQFPAQGVQMSFELPPPAITHGTPNSTGIDSRPSSASAKSSSASSYHPTSPKSPVYASATPAAKRRQSSSQAGSGKDGGATAQFALPPPPTRSRKIIQMKPRQTEPIAPAIEAPATHTAAGKGTLEKGKKKQPSSTSVAGRKIARKTAHSLIERRRRSKMNEEFGVLKDMIPACTGEMHKLAILQASIDYIRYLEDCVSQLKAQNQSQDQLQPSNRTPTPATSANFSRPSSTRPPFTFDHSNVASYANSTAANQGEDEDSEDQDVDMEDSVDEEAVSPTYTTHSSHNTAFPSPEKRPYSHTTHQPSVSPVVLPQDHQYRNNHHKTNSSYSSSTTVNTNASSSQNRQYSFSSNTSRTPISSTTSPNFGPLTSPFMYPSSSTSYTHSPKIYPTSSNLPPASGGSEYTYIRSTSIASSAGMHSQLTSPALAPMRDSPFLGAVSESHKSEEREQENAAMAALLMLNSDRRGTVESVSRGGGGGEEKGRGNLSVRDLLSA